MLKRELFSYSGVLGDGVKISDGILDLKSPVVDEDNIKVGVGDCLTCNRVNTCKGENGNAFVMGVDSYIKYETYLATFNCE